MTGARVMVVGAAGQLGSHVVRRFADQEVVPVTRRELDITSHEQVMGAVARVRPDVIVNCAAFNDVDGAEDAPLAALDANAFAVRSLARAAEDGGAVLVHYSTDFVFDGSASDPYREEDAPSPRSVYAASKLLGEWLALDAPGAFVLRVESLFGCPRTWQGRRGTLDSLVAGMEAGRELRVFTDRVVSPSYLPDVADATWHLLASRAAPGLYHCVNGGRASWQQVAAEAARQLGLTPTLVPVRTDDVPMKAARPRFCALDGHKLAAAGFAMPSWQDALGRWLASRDRPAA